jgi:RNA polymerase sigma-70 factor (family 1)
MLIASVYFLMHLQEKFNIIVPPQDIEGYAECLKQIALGDKAAYEWLYKNYCGKLYDYTFLLTADSALSEDIVQHVFMNIWYNRDRLCGITNFNGYIFTAAKNAVISYWRKQNREKEYLKELTLESTQHITTDFLEEKENKHIVSQAVRSLPKRQQLVYRLCREEGRSRKEISKKLNISPFTVKVTMQNALKHLKDYLRERIDS